jgi:hypothetical protein
MGLEFLRNHGARRMAVYEPRPPIFDPPETRDGGPDADLDYEMPAAAWRPLATADSGWRVRDWAERPTRFVDGKDVGETIAWLQSAEGYPVPVRLSEIGAVAVRVEDGDVRREFYAVDRVVSLVADVFPWDEVEGFAVSLQEHGFRLLVAPAPGGTPSFDFETMRKAAQNRSNDEMGTLEEAALAFDRDRPAVVDGRLEPRQGGLEDPADRAPAVGVIKTLMHEYLHPAGIQVRLRLGPGERTPLFTLPNAKLPVVSWYLRLSGTAETMPNWGVVRVELPLAWFERRRNTDGDAYVAALSRLLCAYRTRAGDYDRAPVSLHPIVRAETLLGALFTPSSRLGSRFCRLTAL